MICAGPSAPPGGDQFVAGRENRHFGAAADGKSRMVRRSRQRDISRGEPPAGWNERFAGTKVHAGLAQVVAFRHGGRETDPFALALDVLLNDDRVGAVRHRRAREDAHCLARTHNAFKGTARRGLADHRQGLEAPPHPPSAPRSRPWPNWETVAGCAMP